MVPSTIFSKDSLDSLLWIEGFSRQFQEHGVLKEAHFSRRILSRVCSGSKDSLESLLMGCSKKAMFALGSLWAPKLILGWSGEALGSQDGSRWSQDGPTWGQDGAKMGHDGAKLSQDGSRWSQDGSIWRQDGATLALWGASGGFGKTSGGFGGTKKKKEERLKKKEESSKKREQEPKQTKNKRKSIYTNSRSTAPAAPYYIISNV